MSRIESGVLVITVGKTDEDHHCPECGTEYSDDWEAVGGYYYDRVGGETEYECPGCEEVRLRLLT